MRYTAPELTSGRLFPVVAMLLCFCAPSSQRGQQFFFTNSQQPRFLSGFQQPPSPPQYEDFFQPQTPDPYSPFRQTEVRHPSPFQPPASSNAPQSFASFQQGSQAARLQDYNSYRAPSFLDQITLSPGGFQRDQRLLQAYQFDPQKHPTPHFPSEPDDLGLSTFVDQNLEVDQRPTEDPKVSIPRPTDKERTGDSELRRKPGTRPQAGSRGNFLSPQRARGQLTSDKRSAPREEEASPYRPHTSTVSPRPRGRFSPTTKAPSKVRQFHIRPNKVPFAPRRPLHPASTTEEDPELSREDTPYPVGDGHSKEVPNANPTEFSDHSKDTPTDVFEDHEYSKEVPEGSEHSKEIPNNTQQPEEGFEDSKEVPNSTQYPIGTFEDHEDSKEVPNDTQRPAEGPVGSEDPEIEQTLGPEEQATGNSTLTADSDDVTMMLQDEVTTNTQENTTYPVTGLTDTTSIDDVTASLDEDETDERRVHDSENNSSTFEVLTMNPGHTLVEEDNFRGFVDSALIDVTDAPHVSTVSDGTIAEAAPNVSMETTSDSKLLDGPNLSSQLLGVSMVTTVGSKPLGVSVVTTKSVINGTMFAVPSPYSVAPPVQEQMATPEVTHPTESWVVVASVQTSRSVSGARFLPSSAVKQEERPKSLSAKPPLSEALNGTVPSSKPADSTESIIDKLYRVESELSSGILTGGFRPEGKKLQLEVLTDMTDTNATSTPATTTTYKSPVFIRKFSPHRTTPKPSKFGAIFDTIPMDDLSHLLPPGFKHRTPTTRRTTTPSPKHADPVDYPQGDEPVKPNSTGRSSGLGGARNKITVQDTGPGLKPGNSSTAAILSKLKFEEPTSLLPPGYKPLNASSVEKPPKKLEDLFSMIKLDDVKELLPPGYKPPTPTTAKPKGLDVVLNKAKPVDISAFLPPGFKLSTTTEKSVLESLLGKVEFRDVGALLPPGFGHENSSTTEADVVKLKFPSRPGATRKPLAATHKPVQGPVVPKPKINTGWPTRATTEFTGWPTPSTTPISIEKLLEMAKTATTTTTTTTSTTTTTTTTPRPTTTTPRPTTPGVCAEDCSLAGTVKLVKGATWVPELLDHNTAEWQDLAGEVQRQLETAYHKSNLLTKWFTNIRIDSFSDGVASNAVDSSPSGGSSVLVDYFVELTDIAQRVDTQEMKRLFHSSLNAELDAPANSSRLQLGRFVVDPKYTDFIVEGKQMGPTVGYADEDVFLPQWAIAGIVIGLASLLFVIIFGVTVLVNRNRNNQKKSPTPLTEDMLNELNKNHMGGLDNYGADDLYNMEDVWNDKPYDKPPKKRSSGSLQENSMSNLYDSWRSEWNGYYYNAYYGNGNAGSSASGYSRRRSDYDTNF